jgi:hypothetical protein|tara:strand:- start:810 stop:1583 length:774 start_codon:yes stop_codon:yes gene_type:complete
VPIFINGPDKFINFSEDIMKNLFAAIIIFLPSIAFAQNLPEPENMYVVTNCFLNDGYTLRDAVEEGNNGFEGPINVAFRQPIATRNAAENQFSRIVVWENMEAWVDADAASTDINVSDSYFCEDSQRRFFTSRELGENSRSSADGDSTLVTITACTLKDGIHYSDAYDWINTRTLAREAAGDTRVSSMVLGVLGRSAGGNGLGRIMGVRAIGRSAAEMARAMDRLWANDGQSPDYAMTPAESCQNPVLYRSYFVGSN